MSSPFGHHGHGDRHHEERHHHPEPHHPAPPPVVHHVSHHVEPHHPSPPAPTHHNVPQPHSSGVHHSTGHGSSAEEWRHQPTVRIYCKAEPNYSLSVRDGKVILAKSNPSDPHQHWIRDMKYSTKVKDEEGLPSFSLINKATGEAIKHATGATHPVRLVPYKPDYLDESLLWAESKDTGENYRCIRMVNNIRLNFDGFNGDKKHGGVKDGTHIVLWEWTKGDNQRWKIVSY